MYTHVITDLPERNLGTCVLNKVVKSWNEKGVLLEGLFQRMKESGFGFGNHVCRNGLRWPPGRIDDGIEV